MKLVFFFVILKFVASEIILENNELINWQLYQPFVYSSSADFAKWSLRCNASVNPDGSIRLAEGLDGGKIGTFTTKTALQPTDVDFAFKVRITADATVQGGDGYAVYLIPNSSVTYTPGVCCSFCGNSTFGIKSPPSNGLAIRAYGVHRNVRVDMFPPIGDPAFVWPWTMAVLTNYSLGIWTEFREMHFADLTILAQCLNGKLTVEVTSVVNSSLTVKKTIVSNVTVPGLVDVIKSGVAVLSVTGGNGARQCFNDPIVRSVEFYTGQLRAVSGSRYDPKVMTANPPKFPPPTSTSKLQATEMVSKCNDVSPALRSPPPAYTGLPTYIRVAFNVDRFVEVSDVTETVSVTGSLTSQWVVLTCPSKDLFPDGYEAADRIKVPSTSDIWRPMFEFRNSAEDITMNAGLFDDRMEIFVQSLAHSTPNGKGTRDMYFYWKRRGIFKATCSLNLEKFPFDKQRCGFTFILADKDDPLSQWKINNYGLNAELISMDNRSDDTFSQVTFYVDLERRPQYYLFNLLAPSLILAGLEMAAFFIPPGNSDRPCFSVYLVLSYAVCQSQVLSKIPKNNQVILLNLYIQLLTYFGVACTVYSIAILWFACFYEQAATRVRKIGCLNMQVARIVDAIAFFVALGVFLVINAVMLKNADCVF